MEILENHKVKNVPKTVYYIPNFITESEENEIVEKVNTAPKPKWTQLLNRRLQNWGGVPHPKGMIAEAIPQWLKKYMEKIDALKVLTEKIQLNHVLVNEYTQGQGIMPHLDGPLFYPTVTTITCGSHTVLEFYPKKNDNDKESTVSSAVQNRDENVETDLTNKSCDLDKKYSLLLERRSLVILQDEMYNEYLHGISEVNSDVITESINNLYLADKTLNLGQELIRDTRISLTIRHVPKTSKMKLNFLR